MCWSPGREGTPENPGRPPPRWYTGQRCPPPIPKTQMGLAVFGQQQSCLHLSQESARLREGGPDKMWHENSAK